MSKITFSTSTQRALETGSKSIAFFLEQGFSLSGTLAETTKVAFEPLQDFIDQAKFTGKAGQTLAVPMVVEKRVVTLFLLGLGKKDAQHVIEIEQYRRALGRMVNSMRAARVDSVAIVLPDAALFGQSVQDVAKETAIIGMIAAYHFDQYKTDVDAQYPPITAHVCTDEKQLKDVEKGLALGVMIATAVNRARHWVDSPPSHLPPMELADKAVEIAKKYGLDITVFDEATIKQMGMGGLAGVSAGSDQDCKLVIMEYKTDVKDVPTVAFVGKGITFDSGGLSIKPAASMETMKEDMSGAAAVIAAMQVIAQLKPAINVVAITPLSENLLNGKATKPGDILTFYNGKTAEVRNTDAEGRLILADALSYAVKHYKPDAIIDLATLTGACAYALGPYFSGLMSKDKAFTQRVQEAAERTGDRVWPLPFHDDYKAAIKSDIADICNIGSSKIKAGAITAGFFLSHFVDDVPWVHLDIAGTAFDVPGIPYYGSGATGVGVRLLVDLVTNWKV